MGKYGKRAIVVLDGIWLWIFYIFQEELSRHGLYTIISYNIHEIASVIPFLCIGIAAVILIGLYIKENSKGTTTVIASVESVDDQNGEIIIIDAAGQKITLQSPELVNRIIETDGQKYIIQYDDNSSGIRKLRMISLPENQK